MSHKVLCSFLHEERVFRYAIAIEKFGEATIDLLSESFAREPMCAALGLSPGDLAPLVRSLHSGMHDQWPVGHRDACG